MGNSKYWERKISNAMAKKKDDEKTNKTTKHYTESQKLSYASTVRG